MSTEIDLDGIDRRVLQQCPSPGVTGDASKDIGQNVMYFDAPTILALIAELRRLRAKVAAGDALQDALRGLLLASDASWIGGHDWPEALQAAESALDAYSKAGKDGTE